MGKIAGSEHGFNDGSSVKGMAGLGSGNGEEAEGVGVEAVELTVMAEALDDGLGTGEGLLGILIGQLRDQAAKAGGAGKHFALHVSQPRLFGLSLTQECEECLIERIVGCGASSGSGRG